MLAQTGPAKLETMNFALHHGDFDSAELTSAAGSANIRGFFARALGRAGSLEGFGLEVNAPGDGHRP
jgi:hypothetical protein